MEQAKTTKDKTVDSTKDPLILREFEADGNYHLQTERSSFSMSQLQNLAVVYFDNKEADDHKKVFDKDRKRTYKREAWPSLMIKSIVWQKKRITNLVNYFPRIRLK